MNHNKINRILLLTWLALMLMFPAMQRAAAQAHEHNEAAPTLVIACDPGAGSANNCGGITGGGDG
ncbi:MAG: hypothetical protein KC418_00625 [Anaerolineales bacterium]|nr:hypothetical protein [Anaerolineales bacterium]MCB8954636.1 hypothetical protein [Ardenticatenales bacterium]